MKTFLLFILLSIPLHAISQLSVLGNNSKLDIMIRNSIESYIKHVDKFFDDRDREKPSVYYVSRFGLPTSFFRNDSTRSIARVKYFCLDNYPFSRRLKKMLKEGFMGWFIETQLHKNRITITVSDRYVSFFKDFPSAQISDWGVYSYEYSKEIEDWILVESYIGGI